MFHLFLSNIKKIERKIASALESADKENLRQKLTAADLGNGTLAYSVLEETLTQLGLNQHEVLCVARAHAKRPEVRKNKNFLSSGICEDYSV